MLVVSGVDTASCKSCMPGVLCAVRARLSHCCTAFGTYPCLPGGSFHLQADRGLAPEFEGVFTFMYFWASSIAQPRVVAVCRAVVVYSCRAVPDERSESDRVRPPNS